MTDKANLIDDAGAPEPGLDHYASESIFVWGLCFLMLLIAACFWSLRECGGNLAAAPGAYNDDLFYDNLAWELAHQNGFSLNLSDEQWQARYREITDGLDREWIFGLRIKGPTTSRAPVYPWLLSQVYRKWEQRWDLIRMAQIVLLPAGLALLLVWAGRRTGNIWVSLVAAATITVDYGILSCAGQIMTEALGILCCGLLLVVADRAHRQGSVFRWALAGLVLGTAILVRSTMIGWLVLAAGLALAGMIVLLARRKPVAGKMIWGAVFFLTTIAVCTPWWIRNCQTANAFEPFGSAGRIGMAGGFSDGAVKMQGNWSLPDVQAAEKLAMQYPGFRQLPLAQREHLIGNESSRIAWNWVGTHIGEMPMLTINKGLNHLGLICQPQPWVVWANALLVGSAFAGCFLSRKNAGFMILLITLLSLGTTMLTWSHFGRFAIPVRPFWHIGSSITIVSFWAMVFRTFGRNGNVNQNR